MYKRMELAAVTLGTALLFATNAGATSITTHGSAAATYNTWNTSAYITGPPVEITFPSLSSRYAAGQLTVASPAGNFVFTGPALTTPSTGSPGPTSTSVKISPPSAAETALFIDVRGGTYNVTFSDGESFLSIPAGAFAFASPTAISSITVAASSGSITVDDLFYATASPQVGGGGTDSAPEAATFLLTCGGLFILFGAGRKLAHTQTA